jgi:hypothetical protein
MPRQPTVPEHEPQAAAATEVASDAGAPARGRRRMGTGVVLGKRLRRRTRWILRFLIFLPLLTLLAGLLLMRSAAVGWLAERDIEAALGCRAHAGASFITFDGRIVLRDLVLRVPGVKGPEGEFLRVERAEIDADWSRMLTKGVKPKGVRLYRPRFRISASQAESELNIQGLHPTDPDAMSGNRPLRFDVRSGVLELGEHTPTDYRVLREIGINGELIPSEAEPGSYAIKFQETSPPGAGPRAARHVGMVLTGRVDLRSSIAVVELLNVDLDSWDPANVPAQMRDVWRQLNIRGRIARTKLEYFPTTGLSAVVSLDGVSMDAIVPATYPTGQATQDVLSLRNVGGTIKLSRDGLSADVAGLVEDQTYQSRVTLKTRALTTDAALECRIISRGLRVEKHSTLLPFCPPVVRERLENFCGPTAEVDADVNIRRDSPGPDGPAPFKVAGWLTFEHGAAAFDRVPYPFTEMRGRVEFDDDGIDIVGIQGIGPDGAQLRAKGRIAPPNDDAAVDVDVSVKNVPLDETFMKSLPPSRAEAIDFLFSRARYNELLAAGLVSEAAHPGGPPEFALGGRMDLDISVHSPRGKDAPWNYTVDALIPRAGVLTRAFPLPIDADNVRLRLTERDAKLVAGEFHGLRGGTTGVSAGVLLDDAGKSVIRPQVTIDARGVPIDDLLLHAIEHASGGPQTDRAPDAMPSPAELLRTLRLDGKVDCRAEVTSAPDESINFDIGVAFDELEARPARPGSEPMLALTNIAGSIRLTNTTIEVPRLTAGVRALDATALVNPEIASGADLGWVSATLSGELHGIDTSIGPGGDTPRSKVSVQNLRGTLDLDGIELGAPFEESLAAFTPGLADRIAEVRGVRHPTGRVSGSVRIGKDGPADPFDVVARITAAENLGFNAAGERLDGSLTAGAVEISSRSKDVARFEDAHLEVGVGDLSRAPLRVDGALLLAAGDGEGLGKESRLTIEGKDIPVESPAVSLVLREVVAPDDLAVITQAHPGGRFDAALSLPSSLLVDDSGLSLQEVAATIVPRSLAFDFEGSRVLINSFTGQVSVRDGSVGVEKLVAHADDWTAGLDGRWERDVEGAGLFTAALDVDADSLTPGVRALFPAGLRSELDRIDLTIAGPIRSTGARLVYRPRAGTSSVTGDLRFSGASLDIGAPLQDAEGVLSLHATRAAGAPSWSFAIDVAADRVVAAGLEMTGLRSRISVGEAPGELVLHSLSADCYAGRVSARARIVDAPGAGAPDTDLRPHTGAAYEAEITLAGVCFAPVLEALDAARERADGGAPAPMPTELATDPRRGRLDGTLAISGIAGESTQRSGVGSVRIAGGDVVEMPLVLTLVQLSNFQIPSSDRLDFLQAIFHVNRDQVVFDQIDLLSSSVTISGLGTMSWPDQQLDLRFNSRAGRRVPLVSDLFETVRDEIATTRIRGTLGDPHVGAEPLVGTRDLIADIVGDRQGPHRTQGIPDARQERNRYRARRAEAPTGRASAEQLPHN